MLGTMMTGALAGLTYAISGFAKSEGEDLDYLRLASTCVVGALAGALASVAGSDIPSTQVYLASLGITPLVENCIKWVWRSLIPKIISKI